MKRLSRKKIWITGASSGIGESLAYELSKYQNQLILSARNEEKLSSIAEKCRREGSSVTLVPFDLSDLASIQQAARKVLEEVGSVDMLINNGGISQRSLVHQTEVEIDRKIMEVNYFGNIALTKAILPEMIQNGGGQIAVTTSIVGKFGFPLRSAYSASKHALYGFYKTLQTEYKMSNVHVTMICPGRVKTNISLHALDGKGSEHGKMDEGQDQGISAERASRKIVKALSKKKKEVLVGGREILMVYIHKYIPSLFDRIVQKIQHT